MSNVNGHPIPKELRERFSSIEDDAQRLSGAGVFTQMRTAVQAYFSKSQAVATNVTAEPCVHDFRMFSSECAKCGADWIPGKDYSPVDPVPPAGGDSSQTKIKPVFMLRAERLWGKDGEYAVTTEDHEWLNRCRRVGGDFPVYSGEVVTRLQAEVDSLKKVAKAYIASDGERSLSEHELRAELTKARECLEYLRGCAQLRATQSLIDTIDEALSNQSAPADKGQVNPEHTLFNEIRISEPVNEDGEPTRYLITEAQLQRIRAMETDKGQGEPVAVVMPELVPTFEAWWESDGQYCRAGGGDYEKTFAYRAYENALAEVARLNQIKQ